jgi:hypothetical protein
MEVIMAGKSTSPKRQHRATFSRDKRQGGYLVRVEGPNANRFAGREVPVTMRSGDEKTITLEGVIWTGTDKETGQPVALYTFEPEPMGPDTSVDF